MRVLVLLLIAANLATFGWLYTHQDDYRPQVERQADHLPPTIEKLVLLNERVEAEPAAKQTNQPVKAKAAPAPVKPPEPAPVEPAESVQAPLPQAAGADPTNVDDPIPQPTDPEIEVATTAEAVPEPQPEPPLPPQPRCQIIGPFMQQASMQGLIEELQTLGVETAQRTAQMQQPSGYWVYLPSMPAAEARSIVDDLAEKGVKDYFLGRQNFISLGIFSDKRSGEVRLREMTALGYEARLEPRFQTQEVYWLDLEETGPTFIDENRWQALLSQRENVRRQSVACE